METSPAICPRCKSAQIKISNKRVNPKTGKPYTVVGIILASFGALFGAIYFLGGVAMVIQGKMEPALVIFMIGLGAICLFFSVRHFIGRSRSVQVKASKCLDCKNEWSEGFKEQVEMGVKTSGLNCPQCAKDNIFCNTYKADPVTLKRVSPLWGYVVLPLGVLWAIGMVVMAITTWSEGDGGFIQWKYGSTIAGLGFLAIGYWIGGTLIRAGLAFFRAKEKHDYRCAACGNSWSQWADGTLIEAPRTIQDAVKEEKLPEIEPK